MLPLDARRCAEYVANDWIKTLQERLEEPDDERYTSHRWLRESLPKRMVYADIYGDLLEGNLHRRDVVDVGGGYSALSRRLLERHQYRVVEIAAHDQEELLREEERRLGRAFFEHADWYDLPRSAEYDLVIANDLFPNVDQRLRIFIERFLPRCNEMRLLLTYYNNERWYRVRRVNADEILHVLAWDGVQVERILATYRDRLSGSLEELRMPQVSAFANGRQVCLVTLRGG